MINESGVYTNISNLVNQYFFHIIAAGWVLHLQQPSFAVSTIIIVTVIIIVIIIIIIMMYDCIHYCFQAQFFFSTVWSIGATCDQDGRTKFDAYFKELTLGKLDAHPIPKCIGKNDLPFPGEHTIYDFMYDVSTYAC